MKRILIVDDEENIGRSLRMILEREGYAVTVCGSAAQFQAHPEVRRADAFLFDVRLPDGLPSAFCEPAHLAQVLTNSTTLVWAANNDPDLAGYEIVWRETTAPDWTNAIPVGNVTTATLPLAPKDNFHFGVRAVDRDGHHSPVAFPVTVQN